MLGDSTLDNRAYTSGGSPVVEQLSRLLPEEGEVTLLAADGAATQSIQNQIERISSGATRTVLSVGGNDAIRKIDVLGRPVSRVGNALKELSQVVSRFEETYRACLRRVLDAWLFPIVCTIYNGDFSGDEALGRNVSQEVVDAALTIWNDIILQAALDHRLPALDLRRVCRSPSDFTF